MRRTLVAVLALVFIYPQTVRAQVDDAARLQAAEELVRLILSSQAGGNFLVAMVEAKIKDSPEVEPYRDVLLEWARKQSSWEVMGPPMVAAYAKEFSLTALREAITFYKSPASQSFLTRAPEILLETSQSLIMERRAELDELVTEKIWKDAGGALRTHADRLYDEEKWPEARDAYIRYLEVHPDEVDVISDLGVCYRWVEDHQGALKQFDRALALNPEHWQSLYNKAIVIGLDLGKKPEARELLERLRTLQPHNPEVEKLAEALEGD